MLLITLLHFIGFLVFQLLDQLLVWLLGPQSIQLTLKPCILLLETVNLRF